MHAYLAISNPSWPHYTNLNSNQLSIVLFFSPTAGLKSSPKFHTLQTLARSKICVKPLEPSTPPYHFPNLPFKDQSGGPTTLFPHCRHHNARELYSHRRSIIALTMFVRIRGVSGRGATSATAVVPEATAWAPGIPYPDSGACARSAHS